MLTSVVLGPIQAQAQSSSTVTGVGSWTEQTDYGAASGNTGSGGIQILGQSCVTYSSYLYCVGGQNITTGKDISDVFYAPFSSGGTIGSWTETTDYGAASGDSGSGGTGIEWPSCVLSGAYIYCVAGATSSGILSKVFYAQLSSSGVGPWTETTDYGAASGSTGSGGVSAFQLSCVADSGYVYCTGGGSSKVFYAELSASGVGPWTETTDYGASSGSSGSGGVSIDSNSCVDNLGSIYCIGGTVSYQPTSKVYFAQLSSAGVGAWSEATDYGASSGSSGSGGFPIYASSCADYSSSIFCAGGDTTGNSASADVFFAPVDQLGSWHSTVSYLIQVYHLYCLVASVLGLPYFICMGGLTSKTASAPIEGGGGTTTTTMATSEESTTATGAVCVYTAVSSGSWGDPGTWSPTPSGGFPAVVPAGCQVVIPSGFTVTLPSSYSVVENYGNVQVNGVFNVNGGEFESSTGGTLTNYGSTNINNNGFVIVDASASVTNYGTINNNQGRLYNHGTVNNDNGGVITNGATGQARMQNEGTINNNGGSRITNYAGGTVDNTFEGVMNNNSGGTITNLSGGTFENDRMSTINNYAGGTMTNNGNIVNGGSVSDAGGTVNNNGSWTGGGSVTVSNGGTFINGGGSLSNYGTVMNNGTLTNDQVGTITNEANGTIDNFGIVSNTGSIVNLGSIVNSGRFYSTGTVSGGGSFTGNAVETTTQAVGTAVTSSSSAMSSNNNSSGGGSGIPEFPNTLFGAVVLVAVLVVAYAAARNKSASPKPGLQNVKSQNTRGQIPPSNESSF